MPRLKFQWTLGELLKLIVLYAVALAMLRMPVILILIVMVGLVAPGFILDRIKGGAGIVGGSLSACLMFVGIGLGCVAHDYFVPHPRLTIVGEPMSFLFWCFASGLVWGTIVSGVLYLIMKKPNRVYIDDKSYGPIVWWGFDENRKPVFDPWMRGEHA